MKNWKNGFKIIKTLKTEKYFENEKVGKEVRKTEIYLQTMQIYL